MNTLVEIVRHDLVVAFRTRRMLVLLALALLGTVLMSLFFRASLDLVVEALLESAGAGAEFGSRGATEEMLWQAVRENRIDIVAFFSGIEADLIAAPFAGSISATLLFRTTLFFLPILLLLTVFDSIAGDVANRTLCYYQSRVPRWQLIAGRAISAMAIALGVAVLCSLLAMVIATHQIPGESFGDGLNGLLWGLAMLVPFAFAWTGLFMLASTLAKRTFGALVLSIVFFMVWPILGAFSLAEGSSMNALTHIAKLAPGAHHGGLWSSDPMFLGTTVLTWLVFGAVFFGVAILRLQRREL